MLRPSRPPHLHSLLRLKGCSAISSQAPDCASLLPGEPGVASWGPRIHTEALDCPAEEGADVLVDAQQSAGGQAGRLRHHGRRGRPPSSRRAACGGLRRARSAAHGRAACGAPQAGAGRGASAGPRACTVATRLVPPKRRVVKRSRAASAPKPRSVAATQPDRSRLSRHGSAASATRLTSVSCARAGARLVKLRVC